MKIEGEYFLSAARHAVWRAVLDPEILARTLPGCERLERVGETAFRGALRVQLGPVTGRFEGSVELSDFRPLDGYHMKLGGQGPAGFMTAEGDLRLEEHGESTVVRYRIEAQVGGRLAGVGQRVLESSAKVITRQGLEGLGRELRKLAGAPAGVSAPAALAAGHPAAARAAARFVGQLLAELVPPAHRRRLLAAAGLGLAVLLLLLARACWA
jgi:carbon monoxide dehydrogenase subunit G